MFLVVFLVLISPVLYWYYKYNYFTKHISRLKGPTPYPVLGNVLEFRNSADLLWRPLELHKQYGRIVPIMIGSQMVLMVADRKLYEFILSSNKHIDKSDPYNSLTTWLGTGLLLSTGEKWRKRRKMITPSFHFQILEQFVDVFNANGNVLVQRLGRESGKGSTDIFKYVTAFALDTICETAMGLSVNAQSDTSSEYVDCVKTICRISAERTFSLVEQNKLLYPFTENYRVEQKVVKVLHDFTLSVIKSRRDAILKSGPKTEQANDCGIKKRVAFLDLLLQSTIDGKPLSDEDIREEVDTFMFAGHDTTSVGMSFAFFMIAAHPDVQQKILEEQIDLLGNDLNVEPNLKDLQDMKYLDMVIKESLRLYPPASAIGRRLQEDCEFDGMTIRKGTDLFLNNFGIHRDPEYFPDPEKFDPERFSGDAKVEHFTFVPFSAGPRNCIGQKYALLEMKATISKVVRNFKLSPVVPEHKLILLGETILKSKNGVIVKIEKRT